jgi:hypothetical protein
MTEVFDKPLEFFEMPWIELDVSAYIFELDDKNYYRVFIEKKHNRYKEYSITFDHVDSEKNLFKSKKGKYSVLSGKNSIKVFATVVAIIKDFYNNNKDTNGFYFTASSASSGRQALYLRFAKNIASSLGWVIDMDKAKNGIYHIQRNKLR